MMQAAHTPDGVQAAPVDGRAEAGSSGLQHAAMPYRGADELAAGVASFVQAAARAGGAVLIAAAAANLRFLRERLHAVDGQVAWADISSAGLNPARLTARLRQFAAAGAGQRLWCVHEPAWPARSAQELREVFRHEALLNLALAGAQVSILCPYDTRLGGAVIDCAEQTHPAVIHGPRREPSSSFIAGAIPAGCDLPLHPPPADAEMLEYRDELAGVRRFAAQRARLAGLAPDRVADLVSAVSELAANTLSHTTGLGTLSMWVTGGEVICQVEDTGQITDVLAGTARRDPVAPGGGRGLWVVHQVCDLAEIRTGPAGTTIRVHMRLDC
jgi:anti-sigma regulatory factor (Ser/Thr protein kinase)